MKSGKTKRLLANTEPWIRDLFTENDPTEREQRFLQEGKASDGTPLQVVELTGDAGDVILMDLCALHSISANVRSTPRLMIGQGLFRPDGAGHGLLRVVAEGAHSSRPQRPAKEPLKRPLLHDRTLVRCRNSPECLVGRRGLEPRTLGLKARPQRKK